MRCALPATSAKCQGAWLTLGLTCDAVHGLTLTSAVLDDTDETTINEWRQSPGDKGRNEEWAWPARP